MRALRSLLPAALLLLALAPSAARAQCNDGSPGRVAGVDVSHYQGTVQWKQLPAQGVCFAYIKATEGTRVADPLFAANWAGARKAGVLRGAYHFFHASASAEDQAEAFIRKVGALDSLDLPPALDVEVSDAVHADSLVAGVLRWLQAVEAGTGKKPILYSGRSFAHTYLADPRLASYPLWIADYSGEPSVLPGAWHGQAWAFWQHSQKGSVRGVPGPVDLDTFRASLAELRRFAASGVLPR